MASRERRGVRAAGAVACLLLAVGCRCCLPGRTPVMVSGVPGYCIVALRDASGAPVPVRTHDRTTVSACVADGDYTVRVQGLDFSGEDRAYWGAAFAASGVPVRLRADIPEGVREVSVTLPDTLPAEVIRSIPPGSIVGRLHRADNPLIVVYQLFRRDAGTATWRASVPHIGPGEYVLSLLSSSTGRKAPGATFPVRVDPP